MATHSSILPGKFHEHRRLAGYSPLGHRELDTTEQLKHFSFWVSDLCMLDLSGLIVYHDPWILSYFIFTHFLFVSFWIFFIDVHLSSLILNFQSSINLIEEEGIPTEKEGIVCQ